MTPLHIAAFKGHADVVNTLLENGADVSSVNKCVYPAPLSVIVTSSRRCTFADTLMHNAGTRTLHFTVLHSGAILPSLIRCLLPIPISMLETCKRTSIHVALVAAAVQDVKGTPMPLAGMGEHRYIRPILNRIKS